MKYFYLALAFVFFSCSGSVEESNEGNVQSNEVKYAKGFAMETRDGVTYIDVYNPWNSNKLMASYVLVANGDENIEGGIQVPLDRITTLSSTYLGMIAMLDARESIVATSNANWICDSVLYSKYLANGITNLGNDMSISAEAVIADRPNAVLKYIYQSPDPIDPVIEGSGIPVLYIIEFMEEHPLGRAEWIKVIGALLDKKEVADSVFSKIEQNYNYYSKLAQSSELSPSVLCGSIYKGTWYAAGGRSFIAQLLKDANSEYYWAKDTTTGSLSLSFETIINNQKDADIWINANALSLDELLVIESRSEVFNSFQNGNVYHYNKNMNENGGLDYYETGVVRPDLLLRDLLVILHPELLNDETVYYRKLQ